MCAVRRPAKVIPITAARRRGGPRPPRQAAVRGRRVGAEFVELCRCRGQAEALVIRGLLESAGVPVALRSRLALSVHPFSVGDQGEVAVLVPEAELGHARAALSR
jgi:hypothetical protein